MCTGRELKGRKGTDGMGLKRGGEAQCVPWTCMKNNLRERKYVFLFLVKIISFYT